MLTIEQKINIITKALALINNPDKWTQGTMAKDATSRAVRPHYGHQATRWCAVGAVWKCLVEEAGSNPSRDNFILQSELDTFINHKYHMYLAYINDHYGREKAIEALSSYLEHLKEQLLC